MHKRSCGSTCFCFEPQHGTRSLSDFYQSYERKVDVKVLQNFKIGTLCVIVIQTCCFEWLKITVADWDNPVTFITLTSGRMFQTSGRMFQTSGRMFRTSGRMFRTSGRMFQTSGRTMKHPAGCFKRPSGHFKHPAG